MPYTSDSWTFGHVPTTFKRLPTVNRWGVLHGFYSDQRDDQELSNSAPDMPSGVGFRILANRNIWRFPNIKGFLLGYGIGQISFKQGATGGPFSVRNYEPNKAISTITSTAFLNQDFDFDASKASNIYKNNQSEVNVNGLFTLCLVRAY